jgi:glutamine amidotransferase
MIAIVNYGAGNLPSVKKAFDFLGAEVMVTDRRDSLAAADKIVLPGVGHFSSLETLSRNGLHEVLLQAAASKPFLGICLGMQWLFEGSDESAGVAGAGIFPGVCRQFPASVKSPHVGWNSLQIFPASRLLRGIPQNSFVYYTHSYHAPVLPSTTASSEYGSPFSGVVERDNVFGVQFHPEKSGNVGLSILRNFCEV